MLTKNYSSNQMVTMTETVSCSMSSRPVMEYREYWNVPSCEESAEEISGVG